ncbi:TIGR00282 family metallophosphoesterase [Fodinicurvata sp. EGI_FJ10296]|uniref:TIGR00282 family metallophosphoesterase n=1 Tax=Fodinicurvata sp. EGI_FJ10296 TaxID=3231908 RepID=UPI003456F0A5
MRLLFIGDIVGRTGREMLADTLPRLRQSLRPDFTIVNGENAAGGFGITAKIAGEFFDLGADCVTLGNHSWDQREMLSHIDEETRLVRPGNYPAGTPGRGATVLSAGGGRQVMVINLMGRLFMDALDDPFAAADRLLADIAMPRDVDAIVVDFHAEATSEKYAFGHYLDGRASLVVGTHTHVPTADHHIMEHGTAFQSDAGMTGDYDSVIGMRKEISIHRFVRKLPGDRMTPSEGPATLCGLVVDTDDKTGLAVAIRPLRVGGVLSTASGTAE